MPSEAVFVTGGQPFVYVVKADSTVARAAVQLGTRTTDVVEVPRRPGHRRRRSSRRPPEALPGRQGDADPGRRGGPGQPRGRAGPRAGAPMKLSEISIQRPVFAAVMSLAIVLLGSSPSRGCRCASTRRSTRRSSRSRPSTAAPAPTWSRPRSPTCSRSSSRPSKAVKTITSLQPRAGLGHHHRVRTEPRRRRGGQRRARPRVARARASCRARPTTRSSPRSTSTPSRSCGSRFAATGTPRWSCPTSADRVLKERLQRLPGVGSVFIGGERRYAMRVWLDPMRMAAHGLTAQDVERRHPRENAEIPGGRVEGSRARVRGAHPRRTDDAGGVRGPSSCTQDGDDIVRLDDVAEVEVGAEDERTVTRFNGQPAVGLGIVKQKQASTLDVADAVRARRCRNCRRCCRRACTSTCLRLLRVHQRVGARGGRHHPDRHGLVVLVVLVFLQEPAGDDDPGVAIPISIIGTFTVAYALGFTINILTLLALVLAIGLVVDDAIVVLENVYRHLEMGKTRRRAAFDGVHEIGFAVIATTIALVAVFIPVAFLTGTRGPAVPRVRHHPGGRRGDLARFVALTLTPMLCSLMLRPLHEPAPALVRPLLRRLLPGLDRTYARPWAWPCATARLVVRRPLSAGRGSVWFFRQLPRGTGADRGPRHRLRHRHRARRRDARVHGPVHAQVEEILLAPAGAPGPLQRHGLGFGGPGRVTNGFVFLNLKPRDERERSQQEIVGQLFPRLLGIPGVLAFVVNPPSLGDQLHHRGRRVRPAGRQLRGAEPGRADHHGQGRPAGLPGQPGHRPAAEQAGAATSPSTASGRRASASRSPTSAPRWRRFLGGRVVGDFKRGSKQYDVIAQLRPDDRATPDVIRADLPARAAAAWSSWPTW